MHNKVPLLYEDATIRMVLSAAPIAMGHAVIQIKTPADMEEWDAELTQTIVRLCQAYVRLLKQHFSPDGYSLSHSGGAFRADTPAEIHLFPRYEGESFKWTYAEKSDRSAFHFDAIRNELSAELNRMLQP